MLHRVLLAVSQIPLASCAGNNTGVVATKKPPPDTTWIAPAPRAPVELPADHVRDALDHALAAIDDAQQGSVDDPRRSTYVASVRAWQGIDADQPLLQQQTRIHLAFVTIANALAAARGVVPPFTGVSDAPEHRPDLDAFAKHTKRAAPAATRDALAYAMAIRFEATRLERANAIDHRRVDWTKAGLLGAANALETMVPPDATVARSLSAAASRAVNAIDVHATFAFQRPAIQDALRAVVSAYRAVAIHEVETRRQAAR